MAKTLTITAVSGWAIPKTWFATEITTAFPGSQANIIYPHNPDDPEEAKLMLNQYPADLYIGYSLGSLWLLKYQNLLPKTSEKALIAPILSFLEKDGLGGNTSETQLKYLARILKQSPDKQATLKSFFSYSDLPFPENFIDEIPDREVLIRGLEFLQNFQAKGDDAKIFLSIVGENDSFINGDLLKKHITHLDIIQGVSHAPGDLLKHLANQLNWKANSI
jgi:hypothetical protein